MWMDQTPDAVEPNGAACSGCPGIAEQGRLPEHLRQWAPGSDNCRGTWWTATGSAGWTGGTVGLGRAPPEATMAVGSSGGVCREVITAGGSTAAGVRLAEEAVGPFSSPNRCWEVAVAAVLLSRDGVRRGVTVVAAVGQEGAMAVLLSIRVICWGRPSGAPRLISLWVDFREDGIFIC